MSRLRSWFRDSSFASALNTNMSCTPFLDHAQMRQMRLKVRHGKMPSLRKKRLHGLQDRRHGELPQVPRQAVPRDPYPGRGLPRGFLDWSSCTRFSLRSFCQGSTTMVTARGLEVQARILPSKKADQTEFVPEIVNHFRSPSCYRPCTGRLDSRVQLTDLHPRA